MAKQINFIIPDEMAGRSTPSLVDEQAGMDSLISLMTLRTMGASRGSRIMGWIFPDKIKDQSEQPYIRYWF